MNRLLRVSPQFNSETIQIGQPLAIQFRSYILGFNSGHKLTMIVKEVTPLRLVGVYVTQLSTGESEIGEIGIDISQIVNKDIEILGEMTLDKECF